MRGEVLWRGSVGIGLAFLSRFGVVLFQWSGRKHVVMFLEMFSFSGVRFLVGRVLLLHVVSFVLVELFVMRCFVTFSGTRQGFTREHLDGRTIRRRRRGHGGLRQLVRMTVIVVFEVFENVADVEESIAVEANVHESGLHAGEDAGDFSFVDAADEREFFFPLDVNFD